MEPSATERPVCPVCGAAAPREEAVARFTFLGQSYRFCCLRCRDLFARHPEHFVVHLAHEPQAHLRYPCLGRDRGEGI